MERTDQDSGSEDLYSEDTADAGWESSCSEDEQEVDGRDSASPVPGAASRLYTEAGGRFACDLCPKSFGQRRYVTRHIRKTHRAGRGRHQCPVCDRYMMQKSDLKRHLATHTDSKEHTCPICQKSFTRKDSMLVHKRQHSNDYTFKCEQCGRGFHSRVSLESHTRIHTGDRPYPCPSCNATFRQKGDLTRHLQSHMGIKPYECAACGKTFGRNADLRRHQMTHEEEKPWHCALCAKGFSRKYLYTKHVQWHEANPHAGAESNNNNDSEPAGAPQHSPGGASVLQDIPDNHIRAEDGGPTPPRGLVLPPGELPGYLSPLDGLPANHDSRLQTLADRLRSKMENLRQLPQHGPPTSADRAPSHGRSKRKSSCPTKRPPTPQSASYESDDEQEQPLDFSLSAAARRSVPQPGVDEPLDLSVVSSRKHAQYVDSNDNVQNVHNGS